MGSHRSPQLLRTLRRGLCLLLPPLAAAAIGGYLALQALYSWRLKRAVLSNAVAMLGQPYRYGGSAPGQGFDCSGLVQYTHGRAALPVPRTSTELYRQAKPKDSDELTPGDLVFFNTRSTPSHVGIYLGKGQFVHAPYSGEAVRTENLLEGYWRERFIGAGHFYVRDS